MPFGWWRFLQKDQCPSIGALNIPRVAFRLRSRARRLQNIRHPLLLQGRTRILWQKEPACPNDWERQLHAADSAKKVLGDRAKQRSAFWQMFIDRVPGELERSGPAQATSNRWRELKDLGLAISMYAAQNDVGLFIRAPRAGNRYLTRERLESVQDLLKAKLGAEMTDSDQYFFGNWIKGDYTDPAQQDSLIDWLATKADLYERTLQEVLGSGGGQKA